VTVAAASWHRHGIARAGRGLSYGGQRRVRRRHRRDHPV